MNEKKTPQMLWLALGQCLSSHLEIGNNGFEHRVPVFHDNSRIESFPFNDGACSTNSKTVWSSMFSEPCKKKSVAIGLTSVAVVAHIEQYVKVLFKEYVEDCKNGLLYLCIMWRTLILQFLNDKLEGVTASNRSFLFKRNQVMNAKIGSKDEVTIRGIRHLVWRLGIDLIKGQLYHNDTIVPVKPIAFHSSAMRFSAARLISSECFQRASASSYVGFLISIIIQFLYISAAKLRKINDKK